MTDLLPRQQRADETEAEKPSGQHSSDMKVDDVVIQLQEKAHQSSGSFWDSTPHRNPACGAA